jgi:hypothetical protein
MAKVVPCLQPVNADAQLTREQKRRVFTRTVEGEKQKWMYSNESCIQQNRIQAERTANMKIELAGLKKKWLNINLELKNTKAMLKEWETVRYPSWKTRLDLLAVNLKSANEQVVLWQGTAEKYRKMYLSRTPRWYQHPAFVATVSALATAGVLYLGSQMGRVLIKP